MKRCKALNCRRKAAKHKVHCHKHHQRQWRQRNPLASAFAVRRDKARRRGIEWTLTLEQFKTFCDQTDLLRLQGNDAESLTIDRIDNRRGYTQDNIRPLTRSENTTKWNQFDETRMVAGYAKRRR